MGFLQVNKKSVEKEEASGGGGDYISTSGIYDVTLRHVEIVKSRNNATQANYFFDKLFSYGNTLIKINKEQTFRYDILVGLAVVMGEDSFGDPEPTAVKFKKETKQLNCIPEVHDVKVKIWAQFSYSLYQGKLRENITIKRFYRDDDGASSSEIFEGSKIGARLAKDMKYSKVVKFENDLTPELVAKYKQAKFNEESSGKAAGSSGDLVPQEPKVDFPY